MNHETIKSVLSELEPVLKRDKEVLTEALSNIVKTYDQDTANYILENGLPHGILCHESLEQPLASMFGRYCEVSQLPRYASKYPIVIVTRKPERMNLMGEG